MPESSNDRQWDITYIAEGILEDDFTENMLLALPEERFAKYQRTMKAALNSLMNIQNDDDISGDDEDILKSPYFEQLTPDEQIDQLCEILMQLSIIHTLRSRRGNCRRAAIRCAAAQAGLTLIRVKRQQAPHADQRILSEIILRFSSSASMIPYVRSSCRALQDQLEMSFTRKSLTLAVNLTRLRLNDILHIIPA